MEGTSDNEFERGSTVLSTAEIKEIYKKVFPVIKEFIVKNSGTLEDAKDVFQEALMLLYLKTMADNFSITASTHTYLAGIARNIWLKKLRGKRRTMVAVDAQEINEEDKFTGENTAMWRKLLLAKYLSKIGQKCRSILSMYFEGIPGEDIAVELQFKTYGYFRVAKKRCINRLTARMKKDKLFDDLKM